MANRWGNNGTVTHFIFSSSKITADGDCSHEIKRCLFLGRKSYDKPRQHIKKQRHYFANKGPYSQSYSFSSSHVWMWELDHKEGWVLKNWCFWTVVLEKTLDSPLDCKEIKPVNLKGRQPWIFIGRTDAEVEAPILGSPDAKSRFIRKNPDGGKDWRKKEKGMTEDETVGWLPSMGLQNQTGLSNQTTATTEPPCDPTVSLLGIHSERIMVWKDTCTSTFSAAWFTTAKTWTQPNWW